MQAYRRGDSSEEAGQLTIVGQPMIGGQLSIVGQPMIGGQLSIDGQLMIRASDHRRANSHLRGK